MSNIMEPQFAHSFHDKLNAVVNLQTCQNYEKNYGQNKLKRWVVAFKMTHENKWHEKEIRKIFMFQFTVVCFNPQLDPRCRPDPLGLQDLDPGLSDDPPVYLLRWVTAAGYKLWAAAVNHPPVGGVWPAANKCLSGNEPLRAEEVKKSVCISQGSVGKEEKKSKKKGAGSSLQEVKRRGRMERSREGGEEGEEDEMSRRLKTLVSPGRGAVDLWGQLGAKPLTVCVCVGPLHQVSSYRNRPGLLRGLHSPQEPVGLQVTCILVAWSIKHEA